PNHTVSVSYNLNGSTGSGSAVTLFPGDTVMFNLTYTATGPAFNYSLSNSGNLTITKGASAVQGQSTITKTLTQGTTQSVNITATEMNTSISVQYGRSYSNTT